MKASEPLAATASALSAQIVFRQAGPSDSKGDADHDLVRGDSWRLNHQVKTKIIPAGSAYVTARPAGHCP